MRCPSCNHQNPADANFCVECGGDLLPTCPGCGTANPAGAKFCKQCRASLAPASPAASASTAATISPPLPPQAAAPIPSAFAGGRYTVRRFLGEGAKKRVYLAHDAKLDREVAFALI